MRVLVREERSGAPEWRPATGDFFDAVVAALEYAGVPALVVEQEQRPVRGVRRALRATVTADRRVYCDGCAGCGDELGPEQCDVCATCRDCCSCERPPCIVCGEYAPDHIDGCMVAGSEAPAERTG